MPITGSAAGGDATEAKQDLLLADVGDASGATLGSILGILGDPATTLTAQILVIDNFVDDLETRLTALRAGYLDELDFDLAAAIAAIPTVMVGTNNAALAADWTNALATALAAYTAARGAYLDELDFDLAAAIAAIPTVMVGTDGAALVASGWDAALATILDNFSAARIGYLDELDFDLAAALTAINDYVDGMELAIRGADSDTLETLSDQLDGIGATVSNLQTRATTIDLQQAAGSYDLATCGVAAVIIESFIIALPNVNASDDAALTGITVQTDHATPQVIIDGVTGDMLELTAENQLFWIGKTYLGVGDKVQLTIAGGAADAATVCNVTIQYRAVAAGGVLA